MKFKSTRAIRAVATAAIAQPALAEWSYDKNGEITHVNGVPVPPIQTVEQARAQAQKEIAAANKAREAVQAENNQSTNRNTSLAAPPQEIFYTGKPYIEETGQYAFLFRSYDPELGRWTTADPSGFPDGANNLAYMAVPTYQTDPFGLWVYSVQLAWHWLEGSGSKVTLPWIAFDPDNTTMNLAGMKWRSDNLRSLIDLGRNAPFGASQVTLEAIDVQVSGYTADEPAISHFQVYAYLESAISINKYWEEDRWRANLSWTLEFLALDIFDFNPGDRFGPYGILKDDWFIAFQQFTGVPKDFGVTGFNNGSHDYTIFE